MKITDVKAYLLKSNFTPEWPNVQSQTNALMYYEEYTNALPYFPRSHHLKPNAPGITSKIMIEILTDEGVSGIHLPVEQDYQVELVMGFKNILIGKDPLATRTIWDMMDRSNARARVGLVTSAMAAIDCALWDLKGKAAGMPVYKLLGGGRKRLAPYISTLGCSVDDMEEVKKVALKLKDEGITAQKWFFKYCPSHGFEGMNKNLELAYTLRETLGDEYPLMFDAWAAWDLAYCLQIFPELEAMNPTWIEEPLRADRIETFKMLRSRTNVQISLGEKLFNRFELHEFLKERLVDVYQPEPEIAGGITEIMRMGELCELYGVKYLPHGLSLMPNISVSAAMSPDITPNIEWLARSVPGHIHLLKNAPQIENGWLNLNDEPGLFVLDESRIISAEELKI